MVKRFIYSLVEQQWNTKTQKYETIKTIFDNHKVTQGNVDRATSKETMKFFKAMGSKQRVERRYNKDGNEVIKIFSYAPNDLTLRNVHTYIEYDEK